MLLPAPFSPTSPRVSPGSSRRLTFRSAQPGREGYRNETSSKTMGSGLPRGAVAGGSMRAASPVVGMERKAKRFDMYRESSYMAPTAARIPWKAVCPCRKTTR